MSDKQIMGHINYNSFLNQCTFLAVSYDKYLLWYSVCDTDIIIFNFFTLSYVS